VFNSAMAAVLRALLVPGAIREKQSITQLQTKT
jgi:hypothetical protein